MNEITLNGTVYVPKKEAQAMAVSTEGLEYCIIRTFSAGVHAGYVKSRNRKEVELVSARRIWYWKGAFTLSELATVGTKRPDECKFSCEVPRITLTEAIEIIPCTENAKKSLMGVENYEC